MKTLIIISGAFLFAFSMGGYAQTEAPAFRDIHLDSSDSIHFDYYKTGAIKCETRYHSGKKEGVEVEYFESGKKKSETPFKNGKKQGWVKIWDEKGKLVYNVWWYNGVVMPPGKGKIDNKNLKLFPDSELLLQKRR
jgi:hypothetical protein